MSCALELGPGPLVLVDDNSDDLLLSRMCFERSELSNELLEFTSGKDLLAHLAQVESGEAPMPGLVLLDINMPGQSGLDVLADIRSRARLARVPVILMLSNSDNPQHATQAAALGANGYQTKPTDVASFVDFFNSLAPR